MLVKRQVAHFGWRVYRSAPDIIEAGRRAGRESLDRIARLLPAGLARAVHA